MPGVGASPGSSRHFLAPDVADQSDLELPAAHPRIHDGNGNGPWKPWGINRCGREEMESGNMDFIDILQIAITHQLTKSKPIVLETGQTGPVETSADLEPAHIDSRGEFSAEHHAAS